MSFPISKWRAKKPNSAKRMTQEETKCRTMVFNFYFVVGSASM
jgi:hypothetical protein